MHSLDQNLTQFIQAVRKGQWVHITSEGEFFVQNIIRTFLKKIVGLEENQWIALSKAYRKQLDVLEKFSISFSEKGEGITQLADFFSYIQGVEAILEKLSLFSSKEAEKERHALERRKVALLYRLGRENGGVDPEISDPFLLDSLFNAVEIWKNTQTTLQEKSISFFDKEIIYQTSQFPLFTDLLLKDNVLLKDFLDWALRDRIAIAPFIEFPFLQEKIIKAALNGRIGRLGGEKLRVQKQNIEGEIRKIVTLPIQGKEENLLEEERVILFRGNYSLTLREIFQIFENKQFEPGRLEYLQEGIINWNSHCLGWWDAETQSFRQINLNHKEWWKELPILEKLSLKEARQKFGSHLTGREWNIALISSRLTPDLDFNNTHSYTSLAVPQQDGTYVVYPFGKYATTFPRSVLEALFTLGKTLDATVAYPEENIYYTHRQKARLSFAVNQEEAFLYLESIRKDLLLARDGHLVYQIESENCARWVFQKIEAALGRNRVPDIFQMPLLECEPHSAMEMAFNVVRALPYIFQKPALWGIHYLLGACHGRWIVERGRAVWKSLTHHTFWKDQMIFHPPRLHQQQESGNLRRYVSSGVTFLGKIAFQAYGRIADLLDFLKRVICFLSRGKKRKFHSLKVQAFASLSQNSKN